MHLLSEIIEHSAAKFPHHVAFRFKNQFITYAILDQQTNHLANALRSLGIEQGDRVGIYMPKCLECATAIYGIMRAGAAYVPLDPTAPVQRIAAIIEDCGIQHIITHHSKQRQLKQLAASGTTPQTAIGIDNDVELPYTTLSWTDIYDQFDNAELRTQNSEHLTQDSLAYIIYTSGSTGEPKGIMHTHASGLAYAQMAADLYGLTHVDRLSNFPPLHFDQSTFDFFSGPLVGATTVIIPDEVKLLPASLAQLIADEELTIWYSVPFALIQLLLRGALEQHNLSSLRWIIYGGEPFPLKHLHRLMELMPRARFSNNYGPAEVNQCTYYHMPPLPFDSTDIPIGQPCPNMEPLVVDDEDHPVAVGEVGELLMRTPTMMRGYWQRPERNAKAFYYRENENGTQDRFYRTGDLVQMGAEGNYHFLGRKDRQVKTRGYRVELDEVEAVLLSHDAVEEGAVFPVSDQDGNTLIKSAVIFKEGEMVKTSALFQHLAQRLPAYALPSTIRIVNQFPRTTSGKIDRRALAMAK
ncbi:amino acid adenylation domain-containing protein [Chloroflexi bacterium TSY]|nr:amino acid adenylation domain-containing protein [Chloroflexi bacterium TSY]